jgi:peptidoglycan hydrolase-like protein with peptidoglycan-binding domain
MLIPGVHHQEVMILQEILQKEGCLDTDTYSDYYDEATEAAVEAFQDKYNLKADGVAGMETIEKMIQLGYVNQVQVVSRQSSERRFGEYIPWSTVMEMIDKGKTVFVIEDFYTGTTFKMLAAYGGVHSDVEPLTASDAHTIKTLWGGEYSWVRRPVLVHFNGKVIAASLNGMPHAGMDNMPEGQYIDTRSGGYGYGYNFDSVKGNDFDGHLCLHFKNSKLHLNRKEDAKHQKNVRIAAGLE